jgi:hypothetical protein
MGGIIPHVLTTEIFYDDENTTSSTNQILYVSEAWYVFFHHMHPAAPALLPTSRAMDIHDFIEICKHHFTDMSKGTGYNLSHDEFKLFIKKSLECVQFSQRQLQPLAVAHITSLAMSLMPIENHISWDVAKTTLIGIYPLLASSRHYQTIPSNG